MVSTGYRIAATLLAAVTVQTAQSPQPVASPTAPACVSIVGGNYDSNLPARFSAMSAADRTLCVNQLLRVISATKPMVDPDPVANAIADLAKQGLISDNSVFGPLLECIRIRAFHSGEFCRRAIETLTRHHYGHALFNTSMGRTNESRDAVIADWERYLRQLEKGRPIFDSDMRRMCEEALRAIEGSLGPKLAGLLGQGKVGPLSNLQGLNKLDLISAFGSELIKEFSLAGFSNWTPREELRVLRFQLYRPGIEELSEVSKVDLKWHTGARPFPLTRTTYREVYPAFDLEFRIEVSTSRSDVRDAAIQAVSEALSGLREAHAAHLKASRQ